MRCSRLLVQRQIHLRIDRFISMTISNGQSDNWALTYIGLVIQLENANAFAHFCLNFMEEEEQRKSDLFTLLQYLVATIVSHLTRGRILCVTPFAYAIVCVCLHSRSTYLFLVCSNVPIQMHQNSKQRRLSCSHRPHMQHRRHSTVLTAHIRFYRSDIATMTMTTAPI